MAEVQAVKDLDQVKLIGHLLRKTYGQQIADIWNVGLNLALRISDLLSIRFSDIQGDRLVLRESKTGKVASIKLNEKARTIIRPYVCAQIALKSSPSPERRTEN